MADEITEDAAAVDLGVTVEQLHELGRRGVLGGWWSQGMALSAAQVNDARLHLAGPAPARLRPPWASAAAAVDRTTRTPPARVATPPVANSDSRIMNPPLPPVPVAPQPPSLPAVPPRPDSERRGGRHGGGGPNVRTGREVEIPARAWVASVQRTAVQWRELQAAVTRRRQDGEDAEQIRAQLLRAGVPAGVVDQLQPRP